MMFKPLIQTFVVFAAITLGVVSTPIIAAPSNPWGSSGGAVAEETQQAAPESKSEAAPQAAKEAKAAQEAKAKADFDAKAAKIDYEKIPTLEKAKEGKTVVARVVWVKGEFTATDKDTLEKRKLKANSVVYLHDTLETPAKSTAQIVYTDNASMTFRPNTVLFVNDYKYDKEKKVASESESTYVMDLVTGGFRTVTGLVAKENPDNYKVNTPVATIGVRGTEYSVVYEKDGQLLIERYAGEPCLENDKSDGKKLCLDSKSEQYATADKDSAPRALMEQPEVFATDVEVVPVTFTKGTLPGGDSGSIDGAGSFCIQ